MGGDLKEMLCEDVPPNVQCLFYTSIILASLVNIIHFTYLLNT